LKTLSVGCSLNYQVLAPSASFTFNVLASLDQEQRLVAESIVCTPEVPTEIIVTGKGDRLFRADVPSGPFELRYQATLEVSRPPSPAAVAPDRPGRLPLSILTYTLPSRYCESDLFAARAWDMFGSNPDRAEQVRAICRWVQENIVYTAGATDGKTSAWDVWQRREGVCRDYVHLAIAFCRALTIPVRYVGGYAAGLEPMDFHACFEAYLGGAWHLFDPTEDVPPEDVVVVSRGRDAAQAGLTVIYGRVQPGPIRVTCTAEAAPAGPAADLGGPADARAAS